MSSGPGGAQFGAHVTGAGSSPGPPANLGDERHRFTTLQQRLGPLFRRVFPDRHAEQTVVVIPSLSLDREELGKLSGASHYEERLLCMLMLLRLPRTRVVYVTSEPIAPAIVDYYLHLLPGIPVNHARRRLTLLSCHDACAEPLTSKILSRPRLVERIREAVADPWSAHMTCFNATPLERRLALQLDIPLYACDPELRDLGTKSGSREAFRRAGVPHPDGFERLRNVDDMVRALVELKRRHPTLQRAVVKLEEGFSGEGNATLSYEGAPDGSALTAWIRASLPTRLLFVAPDETWERYSEKFAHMGGIVESFVEGTLVRSPSVQCRVDPFGAASVISTHDQLLGGASGQVYHGCVFPALTAYCRDIQHAALRVTNVLRQDGVLGRFGVDFLTVQRGAAWETLALEINLRKGGTTHPYLMLQFLTDGTYDPEAGVFRTATGRACCYYASDNLGDPTYRGLTPDDLIDIAVANDLHFDAASQQGVTFHLIGALSQYGKLGTVCIGETHADAEAFFQRTVAVLDREAQRYETR